ncbi:MAG: STT3 domain-containing protein [Thermofilaceae archaeon]
MRNESWKSLPAKLARGLTACVSFFAKPSFIAALVIAFSVVIALLLRLAPLRWGVYLNEFDPFYEYYLAEKLLEKGNGSLLGGLAWWFSWWFDRGERDTLFWAPFGRDLRASSQLGAPLFSASVYTLLKDLGFEVDLYTVHAFIPAVWAATASIFAYLLAKEVWDSSAGVLAAVLMACSWPFIFRTNLGAKHEGVAIPFMLLALYLLIGGARRGSMLRGFLAGLAMGIVILAWGGFLYAWNLVSLTVLVWLLFNPEDVNVAKVFLPFIVTADVLIAVMPRFGPVYAFTSYAALLPWSAKLLSILVMLHHVPRRGLRLDRKTAAIVAGGLAVAAMILWYTGLLTALPGRIMAILLPVLREVGVTTVAEHAVPTWASIYGSYGMLLPLSGFGALLCGYRYRRRIEDTLMLLFWVSSAYAAASMARLTLLMAPAVALLAGYAISELTEGAARLWQQKSSAKRGLQPGFELALLPLAIVFLLPLLTVADTNSIAATHQPALILSSSIPVLDYNYQYTDWLSALEWIKANVPENAVIATWWDYGYWISVNTGRNSTCDNATIDTKQIQRIATAFLSSEEEALKIFRELNVSYVVVFEPFLKAQLQYLGYVYFSPAYGGIGGDLAKSYQMARWIGVDPDRYVGIGYVDNYPVLVPADTPEARNATLYRLLFVKTTERQFFIFEKLPFYGTPISNYRGPSPDIPQPTRFKLVYASRPNEWVLVFKVEYPSD